MKCEGLFGRLFGHRYEPRYSKSAPTYALQTIENLVFADEIALILETSKAVTYRCDVCTRCGNVLKEAA
jgi:hypothetical protein